MADGICDICEIRPATVRADVVENGRRRTMELCDTDYRRLTREQGRSSSPMESLFGGPGSLLDEFFGDRGFAGGVFGRDRDEEGGTEIPVERRGGPRRGRRSARAGIGDR